MAVSQCNAKGKGPLSEKKSLKNFYDALREDHLTKASNDAFSSQELNIAECYANRRLCIVLNVGSGRAVGQYNLIFKSLRVLDYDHPVGRKKRLNNRGTSPMRAVQNERQQTYVSIIISKSIHGPEQVPPSLVWLEPILPDAGQGIPLHLVEPGTSQLPMHSFCA
jgi:hypothetical protein